MKSETCVTHLGKFPSGIQECGLKETNLFEEWPARIFVRGVVEPRQKLSGHGGRGILLIGRMSTHCSDQFFLQRSYLIGIPVFVPPDASDQTQPLDMGIVAIQIKTRRCLELERNAICGVQHIRGRCQMHFPR
jgi:hypothetical protein